MSQIAKDILIKKAISLFNAGQIKECLKETLRARKKYPDEPFVYNLLGVLYADMSSYEDVLKLFKSVKLNLIISRSQQYWSCLY